MDFATLYVPSKRTHVHTRTLARTHTRTYEHYWTNKLQTFCQQKPFVGINGYFYLICISIYILVSILNKCDLFSVYISVIFSWMHCDNFFWQWIGSRTKNHVSSENMEIIFTDLFNNVCKFCNWIKWTVIIH